MLFYACSTCFALSLSVDQDYRLSLNQEAEHANTPLVDMHLLSHNGATHTNTGRVYKSKHYFARQALVRIRYKKSPLFVENTQESLSLPPKASKENGSFLSFRRESLTMAYSRKPQSVYLQYKRQTYSIEVTLENLSPLDFWFVMNKLTKRK